MTIKKFTHVIFIVLFIALGVNSFAVKNASATLLGEVTSITCCNQSSGDLLIASTTGSVFLFGYGFNSFSGGSQPLGLDMDLLLGADVIWSNGSVGTYDFNSVNSADFLQISNRLTDGVDENLYTGGLVLLDDVSSDFVGNMGSGPESGRISGSYDLDGASIDFIRLVVENNSFSATSYNTVGEVNYDLKAKWEIHGAPVPEPTTMLLFGAGLVGLAGFGRKKFKK